MTFARLASFAVLPILALAGPAPAQAPAPHPTPASTPPRTLARTLDSGWPRTPEQSAVRFDRAELALTVRPDERRIEGEATLTFTAAAAVDHLVLDLDDNLRVWAVWLDGEDIHPDDGWSQSEGRLTIPVHPLAPGDTIAARIAYEGAPHVAANAPWDGGFVWSRTPDDRPWIATAVQGQGCDLFWPCIDHPRGEPARVDLAVTVPGGLSAPANGRFIGRDDNSDGTTTWRWSARRPNTYGVALNIGPYVEMTGEHPSRYGNRIPLHFWRLESDDPAKARALFDQFGPMLDFFEATIGPYPFADEKMGVVVTPHLGMEHQTINAYGNGYRLDGKGYDWLLQHELAHEWFGNQMTNADWDHMWLHEGLGTYMQPLYARWLHGERAMQAELQTMRLTLTNRHPLVSGRERTAQGVYDGRTGPGLDLYYKGALVAHTLRLLIGDDAFFQAVRRLVYGRPDPRPGDFQPRHADTAEFVALASAAAGRDLDWFFDAYLYQAALPELATSRMGDRLSLEWITPSGRPFPMPVEIEADGRLIRLPMTDGRGEATVPPAAHVILDPHDRVLRRLPHMEAYQAAR